jgi:hypothetical protein
MASFSVSIVPEPPKISIDVKPLRYVAPGANVSIGLEIGDGSGVFNASLVVVAPDGTVVVWEEWRAEHTGNRTWFTRQVSFVPTLEGNYTISARACDTLLNCGKQDTWINVTRVFKIPGLVFNTISEALASPAVVDGAVLQVVGNVSENATVVVNKRVSIVGLNGSITFAKGVDYGFNVTVEGAAFKNLAIEVPGGVGFMLCSSGVEIVNVSVVGRGFAEPCNLGSLNNTVEDSLLNGSMVYYYYAVDKVLAKLAVIELHAYNATYVLEDVYAEKVYTGASTLLAQGSTIALLRDIGDSRINLTETRLYSYRGSPTSWLQVFHVITVRVVFLGQPVEGATVTATGAAIDGEIQEVTNATGHAVLSVRTAYGDVSIAMNNTLVTVTADYLGLKVSRSIDTAVTKYLELELTAPSLSVSLVDVRGALVDRPKPGQTVIVVVSFDLKGFTGKTVLSIQLLKNGIPVVEVSLPIASQTGTRTVELMVPREPGEYSIRVALYLEGLPPIETIYPG